jgi:AraC-like DNA-binding protein
VQVFVKNIQVTTVTRPFGLRAGFHADVDDPGSGLLHAGEQWAAPPYLITPHTHPAWEFYLQVHGVTHWNAGSDLFALRPGHLLGVPPRVSHHMSEHPGGNHHFYFAAIDVATVLSRRRSLAAAWRQRPHVLHRADGHALADPFEHLVQEVSARSEFAPDGLDIAVDLLVLQISRLLLPGSRPIPLLAVHPAVARVRTLLDRDCAYRWTLAELAERVGLAPTYLSGLFTAETGCPPHTYLLQRRVERAEQLLRTSDLPITCIGYDVGFGSSQHFARVFRRLTGHSPRDYRKLI